MLPKAAIIGPVKALFRKKHGGYSVNDVEMQEHPKTEYISSGYGGNLSPEDSILKKNNGEVNISSVNFDNVISRDVTFENVTSKDVSFGNVTSKDVSFADTKISDSEQEDEFPDGGLDAWLAVLGAFIGLIPVFGMINSMGAIESYISKNQLKDVSSSNVSWIFSLYLAISFLSCILSGGYFDRNGSTKPMIAGTLIYVGGFFGMANCKKMYQFVLAFSVLSGTGTGVLMTPLVSVVATWFDKRRGIACSIATMGGSVGGIVFPIALRKLYNEVGFPWAIRIMAFLFLGCLLIAMKLAREREKPIVEPFQSTKEMVQWYASASLNWKYFLDTKFLFAALAASFAESSLTASSTFMASYSLARGNSQSVSYSLITANNALGILGRYVPAYLADKFLGRFNVSIITVAMAAFFNFVIWLPFGGHIGALWAYTCLYGFTTGSILSLTPVCIGQISSTQDFGKRYSTAYFLQALITLPVLPIGGAIVGKGSIINYNKFIVFVSVLMAAGASCYYISRSLCVGLRLNAKF
ncbi:MCH4 (YOL119C) [Zygosaccharomyces parabailii]|uniref:BN860_12222g1_1 n=1 Tax=Zygosaccharomyces bailii (strain CLIB 213 / ATCC 58445 / CBS 680 / BCRC 21525 / NBRC 1098 / NCYC 1416 / NRRL Y-2227) TaxID=1333698 RepID=A0A8J2X659_ZYGB2|nr:MCH4 (YOL119C) [Zygosaccharomyces parabailii]CDF87689.1 BN860_12222g1_1 [Zygosaccharomyces bailii CLIB 213]CDH09561.1 probable MCH4-Monocarboxylate permeases, not transporting monocarboxylic acids [Zygosaccharomyces bailii ISA1307]